MVEFKGVNVKGLGAFTFEVSTNKPKVNFDSNQSKTKTMNEVIMGKKSTHAMRPCFLVEERFKRFLTRFQNKDELIKPKSQASVYQRGFQMIYCNPVPIAASCYLHKNVVSEGLSAIFNAVYDLIQYGKNVHLKFGFCNIVFYEKNLEYKFNEKITRYTADLVTRESKLKNGNKKVSDNWNTKPEKKWQDSK